MANKAITQLRKKIDQVDALIIKKLAERRKISQKIGRLKAKQGIVVKDPGRERAILKYYHSLSKRYRLDPAFVHQLFRSIIRYSRKVQK